MVGFVIGTAIMLGLGSHVVVLWLALPMAVFVAALAPSVISFTAGQAVAGAAHGFAAQGHRRLITGQPQAGT